VVLMADSRLGLTPLDEQLLDWLQPRLAAGEVRLLVLLTKADKLNRSERQASLRATEAALGAYAGGGADIGVALFSALNGEGVDDAAMALFAWVHGPAGGVAAQAPTGLPA
jgi:GTP-binding protein